MIDVDISHIWGQLSLPELLAVEKEIAQAHEKLVDGSPEEGPAWLPLPKGEPEQILSAAQSIREKCQVCVVVSADGCLGARGAMALLNRESTGHQLIFTGDSLSPRRWNELLAMLEGKDVCVVAISEDGTQLGSAIALRSLRWLLERRYGTQEAASRIYAVTREEDSALWSMAKEQGWTMLAIPAGVEGGHSILSAAGLLPMALAGIDVEALLQGAADAAEGYRLRSFENPLWLYAAVRCAMARKGKTTELFSGFAPGLDCFGHWWQQLFAGIVGETAAALFPVSAEYPRDLYRLGLETGPRRRDLFETLVRFAPEEDFHTVGSDIHDLDGLNFLAEATLSQVEQRSVQAVLESHCDAGIGVLTMDCGVCSERAVGELIFFLELAQGICRNVLGCVPSADINLLQRLRESDGENT